MNNLEHHERYWSDVWSHRVCAETVHESRLDGFNSTSGSISDSFSIEAWTREDVRIWLQQCVRDFGLDPKLPDRFPMNGRGLYMLTKEDFRQRAPDAGDVLFNSLHSLYQRPSTTFYNRTSTRTGETPQTRPTMFGSTFPPAYWYRPVSLPDQPHVESFKAETNIYDQTPVEEPLNLKITKSRHDSVTPHTPPSLFRPSTFEPEALEPRDVYIHSTILPHTPSTPIRFPIHLERLTSLLSTSPSSSSSPSSASSSSSSPKLLYLPPPTSSICCVSPISPLSSDSIPSPLTGVTPQSIVTVTPQNITAVTPRSVMAVSRYVPPLQSPLSSTTLTPLSLSSFPHSDSTVRLGCPSLPSSLNQGQLTQLFAPIKTGSPTYGACSNEAQRVTESIQASTIIKQNPEVTEKIHLNLSTSDRLLWKFLAELLNCKTAKCVSWEDRQRLTFQIVDPDELAELWGVEKCKPGMTYEKLSRALRYYYKMNIIAKVPGKRLTYRFITSPQFIKKGKRGAKPGVPHKRRSSAPLKKTSDQEPQCVP